jgi:hypothetical protein
MSKTQTNGLTMGFTTSSYVADIVNYSKDGTTADDVDLSDLSSISYREYEGGELLEGGTYTFLVHVDPEKTPLVTGVSDECTITYPISNPANASNATRVFPCYINSYSESGEINGLIEATIVVKVAGTEIFTAETT